MELELSENQGVDQETVEEGDCPSVLTHALGFNTLLDFLLFGVFLIIQIINKAEIPLSSSIDF